MQKPAYHILVCNSFRLNGEPQGACNRKGAPSLLQYLEEEISDRGIDAMVSSTGCLKVCEKGPVLVVHPNNDWYGNIDQDAIDDILDAVENNSKAGNYLIS